MKHFKLFEEFLNELNLSNHWKYERGSLTNKESRIVPFSPNFESGWVCEKLYVSDENGKISSKTVSKADFLTTASISEKEFSDIVSHSLFYMVNSKKIEEFNYSMNSSFVKAVYFGRLLLKTGEMYFVPHFTVSGKDSWSGTDFWAMVANHNDGVTFKVYPQNVSHEKIRSEQYDDYVKKSKSGEAKHANYEKSVSREAFDRRISTIDYPFGKESTFLVPIEKNWKEFVKNQGLGIKNVKDEPRIIRTKEISEWESLFKEVEMTLNKNSSLCRDAKDGKMVIRPVQSVVLIKGTQPQSAEITMFLDNTRTAKLRPVEINPDKYISIVPAVETIEREAGNLPSGGYLVKTLKIKYFAKGEKPGDVKVKGKVTDIFVVDKDGNKIVSERTT